ncbi:MAG: hypothetical protein JW994_06265 [Candidatus Omnitrophica bacterium]|nr:hypothetical protein [Candidatus Omnitrophota bacterium]
MKNSMKGAIQKSLLYSQVLALFLFPPLSIYANDTTPMPYPVFHKGMSYVTWNKESFASTFSDTSLLLMKKCGVESVAIIVTRYQDRFDSTEIRATDRTPSDSSVRHAIRKAHEYGMKVMLKPHIDLIIDEGCTRSDIGFCTSREWEKWFANYLAFITHYARMAGDEDVEFFCVGTELSFATQEEGFWRDSVIKDVRRLFKGQITYAANWDAYKNVKFWDLLDYVGIDAYFPVAKKSNATRDEILSGWKSWLAEIEAFQKTVDKPVIFTESGYCSAGTASNRPWENALKRVTPNTLLQKECYEALVDTFWDKPWFFGVYWWAWNTYPESGGENDPSFTPQNKPAMEYLRETYCRPLGREFAFIPSSKTAPEGSEIVRKLAVEAAKRKARCACPAGDVSFTGELAREERRALTADSRLTHQPPGM